MLDAARDEADLDALLRDWSLTKSDLDEIQPRPGAPVDRAASVQPSPHRALRR
jgi:hypothetical protein